MMVKNMAVKLCNTMIEINPILEQLTDLIERETALRRYL